jgi:hypothetical protein
MLYKLFVPSQAVGASLVYFDLFNTGSVGLDMEIKSIIPVVSGAVAVTGVVAVDLFLTRTTAVGTGGTAATTEGTSLTAMTITAFDNSQPAALSTLSARLTPTGGATAGAVLAQRSVFTEETNAGTYIQIADMVRGLYADLPGLLVPSGTGIRVVQGGVASVGNIGFDVCFDLRKR